MLDPTVHHTFPTLPRPELSPGKFSAAKQAAAKQTLVIPNPRCLRVKDLRFARKPGKNLIPHAMQKAKGIGITWV
jgi:hypothetical protein